MKDLWKQYHQKVNQLSLRERKLIGLASSSMVLGLFVLALWAPLWKSLMQGLLDNNQHQVQIEASQNSISALELRSKKDVNLPYKKRLENLINKVEEQESAINNITSALIRPESMNLVFKGLLSKNKLMFESIKNMPASLIRIDDQANDEKSLYQHSLTLEMQGQYFSGLEYLQEVEKQNWQLYWDELEFSILEYPMGRLRLRVHTLSTSNKVLGL